MSFRYTFLVLAFWVYLFHFPSPAPGQESIENRFHVQAGLGLIYDDNVWQYSDTDRKNFDNNPNNTFFQRTESLDDFIWEPFLYLSLKPFKKNLTTQLFADLTGDFHARNTSLNFGTYRMGLEQGLGEKTRALITYTLTPRVFVGISRERRGGTLVGETVTNHTTRFLIQKEIQDLDLGLTAHYKFRDYNDAFNEQDNDIYGVGLESKIFSSYGLKTWTAYLFELGVASGRNKPGFNNDLSYVSHQFRVGPEVRVNQSLAIGVHYQLRYKEFTTNLTNDMNHYGRRDFTHTAGFNAYYEISKSTEAKLGFERVMRRTNKNAEFFAYDESIATVGISYSF